MSKEYATYILGDKACEVAPEVKTIRVKSVTQTSVGYEIVYSVPVELLLEIMKDKLEQ